MHAHGLGGTDELKVAGPKELGADDAHESDPGEEQKNDQEPAEVRDDDRTDDDNNKELRHGAPDLQEAHSPQIEFSAVVTEEGTHEYPDDEGEEGKGDAEEHGYSKSVDNAGQKIAALVVGSQKVGQGGRTGGRGRQAVVDGAVAEANGGEDHPAFPADEHLGGVGIAPVHRNFQFAAQVLFGEALKDGKH